MVPRKIVEFPLGFGRFLYSGKGVKSETLYSRNPPDQRLFPKTPSRVLYWQPFRSGNNRALKKPIAPSVQTRRSLGDTYD